MDKREPAELLRRYFNGLVSEEEREWLTSYVLDDKNSNTIQNVMQEIWLEYSENSDVFMQGTKDKIFEAIVTANPIYSRPAPRVHILKASWFKYAAAVLIIFGVVVYLQNTQKSKETPSLAQTKFVPANNDVAPGSKKALLTLADGSTIILDSANQGTIARQGNIQVLKLDSGKIAYHGKAGIDEGAQYNTMSTPRGGQYELILSDGSRVWMNAASSITYPIAFQNTTREVKITGEVYFEVAKDRRRPFVVSVNGFKVEVLGTHFNINAYPDESIMRTTLLEGSVRVTGGDKPALLKPGEQAQISLTNAIVIDEHADIESAMAWKNGYFQFNQTDLKTVMRQLSRWYDVDIEYQGKIADRKFWGEIRRDSKLLDVLRILQASGGHFRVQDKKLIVMP